jgi:hypothetical protein
MLRIAGFLFFLMALVACSTGDNSDTLPSATGKSGDIIILMDSLQWKGELRKQLRQVFESEVPGIPRDEPRFKVIWVHPNKSIKLLTQIRNLVYVFTLDQKSVGTRVITENLSPETIDKIKSDTSFYLVNRKNEYSRGQEVMYLFGNTKEELLHHLKRDGQQIQDFFNNVERQRMIAALANVKATQSLTQTLNKQYGITIQFPAGFKIADQQTDFLWLRTPGAEIDKNFFMARKPYESEYQLLPDSLIAWRESICRHYIFEDPEQPESYITTERSIPFKPVLARQVNVNKKFAMELRGLWRTNTRTMGGPFISYTFVNEKDNHLYYLEGFIYSPGKNQRELVREMEAIAFTFDTYVPAKKE